jgi:hypothetical protein
MPELSPSDIAWLAGLLEGEGCFRLNRTTPSVELSMCDEDIVNRAAALMGVDVSRKGFDTQANPSWRPRWRIAANGKQAISVMRMVRPWLGFRRGKKVDEVLSLAEARRGRRFGIENPKSKLNPQNVILLRHLHSRGLPALSLARAIGLTQSAVSRAVKGRTWSRVTFTATSP